MRLSSIKNRPSTHQTRGKGGDHRTKQVTPPVSQDRVTLTQKLGRIAKKSILGAVIGATATGIGVAGAMVGAPLLGIASATGLGIGLAHKMEMMVPSTYSNPLAAPRERTFYGATAGMLGGAFGAAAAGLGLLAGGPAMVAAGIAIGYGSTLTAVRNTIMGVGEQFPNAL